MKRETLRHPKTLDLAARLNTDRPTALGYLTLLWDFTADSAIQGDVGKWPNGAIARACDWMGDADEFVKALVDAKWLDSDDDHRLLVHDWQDHCERWVRAKLQKLGLQFLGNTTLPQTVVTTEDATTGRSPPRDRTEPNQTKPLAPALGAVGRDCSPVYVTTDDYQQAKPKMEAVAKTLFGDSPLRKDDRKFIERAVLMCILIFECPHWIDEAILACKECRPDKPVAYFKSILRKRCEKNGCDINEELAAIQQAPKEASNATDC